MKYKLFGPTGLRVSEICLGTMSFGQDWGFGADEKTSHQVLDAYAEADGNFLDTADKYHNGQTEEYIGSWLGSHRDRMVIGTKYTLSTDHADPNASGNQRKNMMRSVEASLRRLKTDYIDLLWVHAYDDDTPIDETLRGLDDLVSQGKVDYVGFSDCPAWIASSAQTMAELRGWTKFAGLQVEYNLLAREPERDLIPMAKHFGLSVTAWGPVAGGVLTGKYTRGQENDSLRQVGNEGRGRTTDRGIAIAKEVDRVADEYGVTSTQIAIAWLLAQGYSMIPIVGARKVEQIKDSVGAAEVELSAETLAHLNEISAIEMGFPHDFLASDHIQDMVKGEIARHKILHRP